ncbi:hypothetical protein R1sor_007623 [Riccia sorocarpa]|uniref:Uncharacterized protein n=1 Tax=Riccia sorocarpa TaxID=122646 RepID=A0ABD3HUF8_9MARC
MAKRGAEFGDFYRPETAKSGAFEATQGPLPPWCMGSTFSPPQLMISDQLPLIFSQVGKPECIISTGQEIRFEQEAASETSEQTKSFLLSSAEPFVPSGLLQNYLEEDAALYRIDSHQKFLYHGNRLESIKCMDGNIILFFPCGKSGEKIGSSLCYPGADGVWYPVRRSLTVGDSGDLEEPQLSVSPSFGQPVLQKQLCCARMQPNALDHREYIYVAARTLYQVHFCVVLREVEYIRFVATYAATFQTHVSHVTWNPHLDQEAAVLLKNGEVALFDVPVGEKDHSDRVMDMKAKITLESPARSVRAKLMRADAGLKRGHDDSPSSLSVVVYEPKEDEDKLVRETWWRCEFAWHPQILFISGLHNVVKVDCRGELSSAAAAEGSASTNKKCFCDVTVIADVGAWTSVSRFCKTKSRKERILAFNRTELDGMCKFSVATQKHLMLFDARRVGSPVLQWEHGMQEDPPSLLIMLPASSLGSRLDERLRNYQNGRVILAVSFQSGDMRLFFYGSKGTHESLMRKNYSTAEFFEGYEWDDMSLAWEMPVKLNPPITVTRDWREVLGMSCGKVHGSVELEGVECISGIIISSHQLSERSVRNLNRGFTVLQLTGLGGIFLQQYIASEQPKVSFPVRSESGFQPQELNETWETSKPRLLVLAAFFKCSIVGLSNTEERMLSAPAENGDGYDEHCSKEEGMFQKFTELMRAPGVEKEIITEIPFRSHLKTVLQQLSVPLTMCEVTHTVLRMGLPSHWSPSVARLPSKLESRRQKEILPLIYSGPTSQITDEEIQEKLAKPCPLPSLLEIDCWTKMQSSSSRDRSLETGHSVHSANGVSSAGKEPEFPEGRDTDRPEQFVRGKKTIAGEKLFLEGCKNVENFLENLTQKLAPAVISLSDSREEDWLKSELDNHVFRYEISMNIFNKPDRVDNLTAVDQKSVSGRESHGGVSSSFSRERLCTLVAGKSLTDQGEKREGDRLSIMEAEICPVKLSFTNGSEETPLEEQLEEQEWKALEGLQAQLRNWQEKFKPYSEQYG